MEEMMKVSYFPGCTLRTKAKDLDRYARQCAALLGVELCEIPDWQCCQRFPRLLTNDAVRIQSLVSLELDYSTIRAISIDSIRASAVISGLIQPVLQGLHIFSAMRRIIPHRNIFWLFIIPLTN